MKTVYLVLYLWHAAREGNAGLGGPQLTIQPMPSVQVCEAVGAAAKALADAQRPYPAADFRSPPPDGTYRANYSPPAAYRCVAADEGDKR